MLAAARQRRRALALLVFASPASAADFTPGAGTYTANTTTLELRDPANNVVATGADQGGVAVFSFDDVTIPAARRSRCGAAARSS